MRERVASTVVLVLVLVFTPPLTVVTVSVTLTLIGCVPSAPLWGTAPVSRPVELSVSHEGSVTPFHLRVLWYGLVLVPSFCTASWVGGYALRGMASGSDAVFDQEPALNGSDSAFSNARNTTLVDPAAQLRRARKGTDGDDARGRAPQRNLVTDVPVQAGS